MFTLRLRTLGTVPDCQCERGISDDPVTIDLPYIYNKRLSREMAAGDETRDALLRDRCAIYYILLVFDMV